jgi:uncharacterized protein YgiB involved in biofilm formation
MRALILVLMGIAATVMGYIALQGECNGGKVFANEGECRASGLKKEICQASFVSASRKARLEYSPFSTQNDCDLQFPRCEPHGKLAGYVPVPRGVCVVAGKDGEPVYQKYGANFSPK